MDRTKRTPFPVRPATLALLAGLALPGAACGPPPFDLVVRGGTVVDGSGSEPRVADVGVRDGRVAAIGDLGGRAARRAVDAHGSIVAPGFVDLHSHADLILLADQATQGRLLEAKIRQGVTTVVVGNCGLGVAPADADGAEILAAVNGWMTPDGVVAGAYRIADYLDRLESAGVAVNVATLVPHGPVRVSEVGLAPGPASPAALERMRAAIARGLDDGAFGLSFGLIYPPGMFTPTDELVALAAPVAERGGVVAAHVRGSSETLLPATRELIEIARRTGVRVHHSHLEAVGEPYFDDLDAVLALGDEARREGLTVTHDTFPYDRAATMMSAVFPPWALEGGLPGLLARLRDPGTRERIRRDIESVRPTWPPPADGGWPHNLVAAVGWDGILIASVGPDGPGEWVGHSLADLGREQGRDPFDVVADLMLAEGGRVGQFVAEISESPDRGGGLRRILAHPRAALVSDAEDYGRGLAHPAHAGAFARGLRWARDGLLPVPEMVRKMTSHPASIAGLPERGRLAVGLPADVTVFDADTVADRADWTEPRAPAEGVRWVLIGGVPVVEDGVYVGGAVGRVLRAERRNQP